MSELVTVSYLVSELVSEGVCGWSSECVYDE